MMVAQEQTNIEAGTSVDDVCPNYIQASSGASYAMEVACSAPSLPEPSLEQQAAYSPPPQTAGLS